MERFNYKNLAAVELEDIRILQLIEAESFGRRKDELEEIEEREIEAENRRMEAEAYG